MKEKINLQELTSLLAEKAGVTKKDAEIFLRGFFDLMEEKILLEKQLKIKNLGTFKLAEVGERESVDVRSGERMVIPSHTKVQFLPDIQLSLVVNEPFALFESIEIEDEPAEKTHPNTLPEAETIEVLPLVKTDMPTAHQREIESTKYSVEPEKEWRTGKRYEKRPWKNLLLVGLIAFFLIALAAIAYLILHESESEMIKEIYSTQSQVNESRVDTPPFSVDSVSIDHSNPVKDSEKTHRIAEGERLTLISLKEYGDKVFWVYLYEENKKIIPQPDLLLIGLEIIIPDAKKYNINKDDSESIRRAKQLEENYKK